MSLSAPAEADLVRLRQTFASGLTQPLAWRLEQLAALQTMLRQHESELVTALSADLGKNSYDSWVTEIGYLHRDIRHTRKHLRSWLTAKRLSHPLLAWPGRSEIRPEPLGVVLIFGAWNYPVQLLLSPLVAALAAGNCAVIKPSELAPATAELLERILPNFLSRNAVQLVTGGADTATALLKHRFDHIFYTGGGEVGKRVMHAASDFLTPVTLELGGKSPAIVLADAELKVAAKRIAWGKWLNAGQTCIAPDYVLVEDSVHDQFVAHLGDAIQEFYGDDPEQSDDYGRIINHRHWQRLTSYLETGTIAIGGDSNGGQNYISPTVLTQVPADSPVLNEEIFGPILPVISVSSLATAGDYIRAHDKPLALYAFSENVMTLEQIKAELPAGSHCFNDTLMFMLNPELPFGGVGASGMGRYHGRYGFETFSHMKAVMTRSTRFDPSFRYPPYSSWKRKLMRWFTGGSK